MNWWKMILSGAKSFTYVILATVIALVIGALTLALGYKPEGLLDSTLWSYLVLPVLTAIIAMLKNWQQHKNDPK